MTTTTAARPHNRVALARDPQFIKYWLSDTLGNVAGSVAGLALSLTAVTMLSADAFEMGVLSAVRNVPFMGLGLLAGVAIDRSRRRPILAATSVASAGFLLLVPAAALVGGLRIELLYAVAFATGAMAVAAAGAYRALLPVLVGRDRLLEGNSLIYLSASIAQIAGPGLGGVLIQILAAPFALGASAAAWVISAMLVGWLRIVEPVPVAREDRSVLREMREGLLIVIGDRQLRAIMLCGATHNVFSNGMLMAVYVLFASNTLGLAPAEIGLVFAAAGPGSIVGSIYAARLARRLGLAPALGWVQVLTGVARLAVVAAASTGHATVTLAAGELVLGFARAAFNINQISLRQAITPDGQQGRMNASIGFLMWAGVPLGALAGGWAGSAIGLGPTLWISVAGTFVAALWMFQLPERSVPRA